MSHRRPRRRLKHLTLADAFPASFAPWMARNLNGFRDAVVKAAAPSVASFLGHLREIGELIGTPPIIRCRCGRLAPRVDRQNRCPKHGVLVDTFQLWEWIDAGRPPVVRLEPRNIRADSSAN